MDKKEEKREIKEPIPAGLPFLAAGGIFFILAVILPIYRLWALLACLIAAAAGAAGIYAVRSRQIAAMPEPEPVRERVDALSKKLDAGREELCTLKARIQNEHAVRRVESMADTLRKLADNLEKNPQDRNKIRKVAVHYVPMITGLVRSYTELEAQGIEGANISSSMASIEEGLQKIDESLKQYLDDMFDDDKMSIETDIAVLQQLMRTDAGGVNKMQFDDILNEMNGGKQNV